MNKILSTGEILKMSPDELVQALMHGSRFEHSSPIPTPQSQVEILTKTCPTAAKKPGDTAILKGSASAGTPPYTIKLKKGSTVLAAFTNVPANTEKTYTYTIVEQDAPSVSLGMEVSDSCPSGAKTCSEVCSVDVERPGVGLGLAAVAAAVLLSSVAAIGLVWYKSRD